MCPSKADSGVRLARYLQRPIVGNTCSATRGPFARLIPSQPSEAAGVLRVRELAGTARHQLEWQRTRWVEWDEYRIRFHQTGTASI